MPDKEQMQGEKWDNSTQKPHGCIKTFLFGNLIQKPPAPVKCLCRQHTVLIVADDEHRSYRLPPCIFDFELNLLDGHQRVHATYMYM